MRQRRSLSSDIFINITTEDEDFHIQLLPNDKLLAPGFKVYHRHGSHNISDDVITETDAVISETDDVTTDGDVSMLSSCHFKGHVVSHDNVPAAISLCNGVVCICLFLLIFF